jgi:phosphate-selective porin OprO/OprP
VFYFYKSFGIFSEHMISTQNLARAGVTREITNRATEVSASFMLTGEAATYGLVRPKHNFNPAQHHYGALQVLARYSTLTVDQLAFQAPLAAPSASREAKSFTAAMNWFPNANVKYYATFERTSFDGGAFRPTENIILFRTQIGF